MKTAWMVLFSAIALPPFLPAQPPACQDCPRVGRWESFDTNAGGTSLETSFRYSLMEALIDECFHFIASGGREPEYLFRASYHEKLEGNIKSRLKISLYFNGKDEELVKTWVTETDNPDATVPLHKNRMFNNPTAILKAFRPLNSTLLNAFEKRPNQCAITPQKETVGKDETIRIILSSLLDINGKPSREFNRVIVQAVEGEILGGVALESDPELKVFRVEAGTIGFEYKAPADCNVREDTINIYNSCDVLDEQKVPMPRTRLKDKIAERKISVRCGPVWTGTLNYKWLMSKTADYSTDAIKNTTTINRDERASVTVTLEFTNRSGEEDYYKLASLSGDFSLKFDKVSENVQKNLPNATPRTIVTKADCSAPLNLEEVSLILTVNEKQKRYELSVDINSPECHGTMTVSGGPSAAIVERIHAFIPPDFEAATDGKTIEGTFEPTQKDGGQNWTWKLKKE